MANPDVHHAALNATFKGILREEQGKKIHQFLGIKYANVPARFEKAEPVGGFEGAIVDATKYG
jgi:carboxylesterase type B